jgi:putative ABC transport system substrate-binding protein
LTADDPAEVGLVGSLNRPGGNLTGVTGMGLMLAPKRLELLHELLPTAAILALLVNPKNARSQAQSRDLEAAARTLGLQLHVLQAASESEFEDAFATASRLGAGGLLIEGDPYFTTRSGKLATLALRYRMPAVYQFRGFVAAGGLMSYGTDITDTYRLAGVYTCRVLKGEKPGELPVQQSTKVELILNLKTAKALVITVSLPLLGRADEVIE